MKPIVFAAVAICAAPALAQSPAESDPQSTQIMAAIQSLTARVDALAAIQAFPQPQRFDASCGADYSPMLESDGCDSCQTSPPVVLFQQAPTPRLRMSEPPIIRSRGMPPSCAGAGVYGAGSLLDCGIARRVITRRISSAIADRAAAANYAEEGYSWRTSLCDILRRRTVREVGPYQVEVRHGLWDTEVTVLP